MFLFWKLEIRLGMSGKEGKLEEGENSSTKKWLEMKKDPEGKGRRKLLLVLLVCRIGG